ncbi:MAG TPA: PAS domain S-box protein, partial [Tepidiformaceae bacterium]|nr:PAS domain S-box protein [Tepidiformaceae bacterium]
MSERNTVPARGEPQPPPPSTRAAWAAPSILFETNPHPKWIFDLETLRFVDVNAAALAVYGHTREAFLARKVVDCHLPEDREMVLAHLAGIPHDAQAQTYWRHVTATGDILQVELAGQTIEYNGRSCRLVVVVDHTAQVSTNGALQASESRFRALVEHAPEAIVVLDVESGHFIEANPQACVIFGMEREELLRVGPAQVSPPYQPDGSTSAEAAAAQITLALSGESPRFEWVHLATDGAEFPCEVQLTLLPNGSERLIRASITDISERRRLQGELERREQEFRSLAENSPDMIVRFNRAIQRIYVTPAGVRANGTPAEHLVGKRPTENFPDNKALQEWEGAVEAVFASGEPQLIQATADLMTRGNFLQTHLIPELGPTGQVDTVLSITRDLTDVRRAMEDSVQLATIVQSSQDGMIVVDLESRITSWNKGAEHIFGYAAAEVLGRNTEMFFEGSAADTAVRDRIRESVLERGNSIENLERTWRRKDGSTVTCYSSYFPIRNSAGETVGIGSVARDVTDLRRAREELARIAAIVESANDAMMSTDLRGIITSWNGAAERTFGWSADEAIGATNSTLFGIDEGLRNQIRLAVLQDGQTVQIAEREWPTKSGDSIIAASSFFPIRDSDGKISGLGSVSRDVTELVRARAELARLAAIVENSSDAITSMDMRGVVTSWNRAAEELFGYSAEEIVGTDGSILEDTSSEERRFLQREILAGRMVKNLETTRLRKDGSEISVSSAVFPIVDQDGRRIGAARMMRDITERKAAEAALRESEARFRMLADAAPLLIWISNPKAQVEYFSAGWQNFTGRFEAQDLNQGWREVIHPDDLEEASRVFVTHTRERTSYSTRYRLRRADGAYRYVMEYGAPRFDESGEFLGLIGACIDVHERYLGEEALRLSENRLRVALEAAEMGVWTWDLPTGAMTWNEQAATIFRRPLDELPATYNDAIKLLHPEDPAPLGAAGRTAQNPEPGHRRLLMPDGQYRWVSIVSEVVSGADGKPRAVTGVIQDIHERKLAEDQIRESEARFRNVVEGTPDLITRYDAELRFEFGNGAALKALDSIRREPWGKRIDEMKLQPAFAALWLEKLTLARDTRESDEFEYETPTSYGNWSRRARIVPEVAADGTVHHLLCVVTDITEVRKAEEERRRLDQQMQQTQKLESLGVLAGGIAHDFNNLLVAILGNAGLALLELPPESPARQTVQSIETAAQRAAELTRQMLAYSGKGKFVIEALNLSRLVEEMAHLLEVSVTKRAVLKYRFAPDLPAVEGDATQIRQVIMNLITNASDAIGERSGVISISTGLMQADRAYLASSYLDTDLPEGDYVYLEVADTGDGMDETTRDRIFDPFFTTKFTGRGLGLAAVLGIVRGHHG